MHTDAWSYRVATLLLLEVAASRSSLCAPTGSRTGTSSRPAARQGSCTLEWPGAAGCPRRPIRRGTSRWPRCRRCAAPRLAAQCCRSRRGRSRYRCPIRARQRNSTAVPCLQLTRSRGRERTGLQAPQAHAQAGSSAACPLGSRVRPRRPRHCMRPCLAAVRRPDGAVRSPAGALCETRSSC